MRSSGLVARLKTLMRGLKLVGDHEQVADDAEVAESPESLRIDDRSPGTEGVHAAVPDGSVGESSGRRDEVTEGRAGVWTGREG